MEREGALQTIIYLAMMEDIETQEYAAFSLAHLASNRDLQVKLVNMGVVRPLVTMLSSDAEPKHYAGLALLKLADNFENHLRIAEEGGIQALLRLGRTRTTDDQLQYKAALTLGQLASNAVKLLPNANNKTASSIAPISHSKMESLNSALPPVEAVAQNAALAQSIVTIGNSASGVDNLKGKGSRVDRLRSEINAQKERAKTTTLNFLDQSLAKTEAEQRLVKTSTASNPDLLMTRSLDAKGDPGRTVTQIALQIGASGNPNLQTPSTRIQRNISTEITPLHPTFALPNEDNRGASENNLFGETKKEF